MVLVQTLVDEMRSASSISQRSRTARIMLRWALEVLVRFGLAPLSDLSNEPVIVGLRDKLYIAIFRPNGDV